MAALQILVLPVKVRILARQQVGSGENLLRDVTGFFIVKRPEPRRAHRPTGGNGQKLLAQGTPWKINMIEKEQISKLVEEAIAESDLFLVEVKVKPGNVIEVYVDADSAVNIDQCVAISRYAETVTGNSVFGQKARLSGFNVYVRYNVRQVNIGQSISYAAPAQMPGQPIVIVNP